MPSLETENPVSVTAFWVLAAEALFAELGYDVREHVSAVQRAVELGAHGAPPAFAPRLLPSLREGYQVRLFDRRDRETGLVVATAPL